MRIRALLSLMLCGACAGEVTSTRLSTLRVIDGPPCASMTWPVVARVSSGFGVRDGRSHEGIDLPVPENTPVHAACDGTVVHAGEKMRGYGRVLILEHGGGLVSLYAHNNVLMVLEGDRVHRGQMIARSGKTGRASAPHVHFELRRDGKSFDPLSILGPVSAPNEVIAGR